MIDNNLIPPPELVEQWISKFYGTHLVPGEAGTDLATRAAQWGADQELEACLTDVSFLGSKSLADKIRATRRPKPPNLKEQALALIDLIQGDKTMWQLNDLDVVRKALEQLPND
jgi:hypothetical protein